MPGPLSAKELFDLHFPNAIASELAKRAKAEKVEEEDGGVISSLISPITEYAGGLISGVRHRLPEMAGQAGEFLGIESAKDLTKWAREGEKPEERAGRGAFYQAGEMTPASAGVPAALNILGTGISYIPHPVAKGIGGALKVASYVLTPAMFGLSQARSTEETAEMRGMEPGAAPYITGGIEAVGETIGNAALLKLLGPLAPAIPLAKAGAKQLLKSTIGQYGKQLLLVTLPTEISTEIAQEFGEAAVEKAYDIRPDAEPIKEAMSVIAPTAIMTIVSGTGARAYQNYQANTILKALTDPNIEQSKREAAVNAVAGVISGQEEGKTKPITNLWLHYGHNQVKNKAPINIDDKIMGGIETAAVPIGTGIEELGETAASAKPEYSREWVDQQRQSMKDELRADALAKENARMREEIAARRAELGPSGAEMLEGEAALPRPQTVEDVYGPGRTVGGQPTRVVQEIIETAKDRPSIDDYAAFWERELDRQDWLGQSPQGLELLRATLYEQERQGKIESKYVDWWEEKIKELQAAQALPPGQGFILRPKTILRPGERYPEEGFRAITPAPEAPIEYKPIVSRAGEPFKTQRGALKTLNAHKTDAMGRPQPSYKDRGYEIIPYEGGFALYKRPKTVEAAPPPEARKAPKPKLAEKMLGLGIKAKIEAAQAPPAETIGSIKISKITDKTIINDVDYGTFKNDIALSGDRELIKSELAELNNRHTEKDYQEITSPGTITSRIFAEAKPKMSPEEYKAFKAKTRKKLAVYEEVHKEVGAAPAKEATPEIPKDLTGTIVKIANISGMAKVLKDKGETVTIQYRLSSGDYTSKDIAKTSIEFIKPITKEAPHVEKEEVKEEKQRAEETRKEAEEVEPVYAAPEGIPQVVTVVKKTSADGKAFWVLRDRDGATFGQQRATFEEAAKAADKENLRYAEYDKAKEKAEKGFPVFEWGKDKEGYIKRLLGKSQKAQFYRDAKEVAYIDQPYKHKLPVYFYKGKLVRMGTGDSPAIHEVTPDILSGWLQRKDVVSIAERFGAKAKTVMPIISDIEAGTMGGALKMPKGKTVIEKKDIFAREEGAEHKEPEAAYGSKKAQDKAVKDIAGRIEEAARKDERDVSDRRVPDSVRDYKSTVARDLAEKGYVNFEGRMISNPKELVELFQIYRSPSREIFHAILRDADNRIVGHNAITCNGIDRVLMGDVARFVAKIKSRMERTGAVKADFLHNHPSGNVVMSDSDLALAARLKTELERDMGNFVVIDHGKYSWTFSGEEPRIGNYQVSEDMPDWISGRGPQISNQKAVAAFGHSLNIPKDKIALVYVDNRNKVTGFTIHHKKLLAKGLASIRDSIKQQNKAHDAKACAIIGDDKPLLGRIVMGSDNLQLYLLDVLAEDGTSFRGEYPQKWQGKARFRASEEYRKAIRKAEAIGDIRLAKELKKELEGFIGKKAWGLFEERAEYKPAPIRKALGALGIRAKLTEKEQASRRARSIGLASPKGEKYLDISEEAEEIARIMATTYAKETTTHKEIEAEARAIEASPEKYEKLVMKVNREGIANMTLAERHVFRRRNAANYEALKDLIKTGDVDAINRNVQSYKDTLHKTVQDIHRTPAVFLNALKMKVGPDQIMIALGNLERAFREQDIDRFNAACEAQKYGDDKAMISFIKYLETTKADPKLIDYVTEYWYNAILSGIPTHIVNVTSNTAWFAWQVGMHRPLAAALDPIVARFQKRPQEYFLNEIVPMMAGAQKGFGPGKQMAKEIMIKGYATATEKWEQEVGKSIGAFARSPNKWLRKIAPAVTLPTRALRAMDVWAKSIASSAELHAIAKRMEKQGRGAYEDLMLNPTEEMQDMAAKFADYSTFMDEPGGLTKWILKGRETIPGARFVIPFVNTIANLTKRGLEMTPGLGAILGRKAQGAAVTDVIAKQIEGAFILAILASMLAAGKITGDVPEDKNEREAFYRQGKLPWAIQIGGKWRQYRRAEPFNAPIASMAIAYDKWKETGEEISTDLIWGALGSVINNILDASYLSGLTDVLDSVRAADRMPQKLTNILNRTAASFSPMSSFQRSFVRAVDAVGKEGAAARKPKGMLETLYAATPGLAGRIATRKNVWGEEVVVPGSPLEQWLPWKAAKPTKDKVEQEIERLNELGLASYPGMLQQFLSVKGTRVDLDEKQYDAYITESGRAVKAALDKIVNAPSWQRKKDQQKADLIKHTIDKVRRRVRDKFKRKLGREQRIYKKAMGL